MACRFPAPLVLASGQVFACAQMGAYGQQGVGREDDRVLHQCGLGGARDRQHECAPATLCLQHHGERTADRTQLTGEGKFSRELVSVEIVLRNLARGGQNAERDGEVESPAFLGEIGRCEVDGDAAGGEIESGVLQRRAHAVARLAYLRLRQTDDREARQTVTQVHLDGHQGGFHSGLGAAVEDGE